MEPVAYLVERSAAAGGRDRWALAAGVVTIGRDADNDVQIDDREISRRHAQIRHDGARYILVDLSSKNGTRLNGRPIEHASAMADGDEIMFGTRHVFRFVDGDATIVAPGRDRGLRLDRAARSATLNGRAVDPPLAPNQYSLLELLAGQPGRVFSRDEIARACYPDVAMGVSDQAIDGVVRRLRARLSEIEPEAELVSAVRGHGFRLNP